MMRFVKVRATELVLFVCYVFATTVVRAEYSSSSSSFRHPSELFKWSKCVYRDVQYSAGDFVKTGEPCLNCTCSNGAIVCHLRMCTPIPNPPPPGCFILHKRNACCPELMCNDDNNILLDGLEGRSRPGSNDDNELDIANLTKFKNKGCVINGTTYADGSALSSSTDCRYCFCLKGQEQCVKPNCILQLPECTPVFSQHACCPVKYNCQGSDNVTIISTEFSSTTMLIPESESTEKLLSSSVKSQQLGYDSKLGGITTARLTTTSMMSNSEPSSTLSVNQRENVETSSTTARSDSVSSTPSISLTFFENFPATDPSYSASPLSSSTAAPTELPKLTDDTASVIETITEISTSISLIKTELTVQESEHDQSQSFPAERRNTFADAENPIVSDSTHPYEPSSSSNASTKSETSTTTLKPIPPEIEAILNITKKTEEGDFQLDYDEPTLPPSLPNLKIIPFVAADALDKPKDVTIEHREDVFVASDVTDSILDPLALQPGSFSPPVKTEGGFVPRDPTLDGPYFESSFNSVYHHQITSNTDTVSVDQAPLPSITEPSKIVENALCTNGYVTYRHGELISEPKACNMCLCLYGEIVCQKPNCAPIQPGCRRINYGDVTNCCGEVICDGDISSSSTIAETADKIISFPPPASTPANSTENQITIDSHRDTLTLPEILTVPPAVPTIMTIKVKSKNDSKIDHKYKITIGNNSTLTPPPSSTSTSTSTSTTTTSGTTTTTAASSPSSTTNYISRHPTSSVPIAAATTTEKSAVVEPDYDGGDGFSFENMLSFLFDEPSTQQPKNLTTNSSTQQAVTQAQTISTTTAATTTTTTAATNKPTSLVQLLTTRLVTEASTTTASSSPLPTQETDSAIYMIKNDNNQFSKNVINYTEEQTNSIKEINTYYVPPLGNFDEVILNPTKKPVGAQRKPTVKTNSYSSTTYRPRHTTAKVIPLSRPTEKSTPQVISGDPGAASGLLKLSGCNIFGRMYRLGKIIAELSGPCLQCMCADVGVHCIPLKC